MDLDPVLKKTMRAGDYGPPTEACLDAETLAAWSDGSLSRRERDAAEAHAAECDRCLSVLASLTTTLPPTPTASWKRWLSPRWIVPLTAATAAALWIAVRPEAPSPPGAVTAQQASERSAAPSTPAAPPPPTAEAPRDRRESASASASASAKRQLPQAKVVGATSDAEGRKEALDSVSAPASASGNRAQEEKRADTKLERQTADKGLAETAAGQPRPEAAPSRARAAAAASPPPAVVEGYLQAPNRPTEIPSPDPQIRWRLRGAVVERSSNGGQSWQSQSTGTAARLMAGSSPLPTVCWIVGAAGTVLLTTDGGETWLSLPPPEPSDLIAITAGNASQALVTAAGSRVYRTLDGGRTWTLQEPPSTPF